jgi:hypothetical protein
MDIGKTEIKSDEGFQLIRKIGIGLFVFSVIILILYIIDLVFKKETLHVPYFFGIFFLLFLYFILNIYFQDTYTVILIKDNHIKIQYKQNAETIPFSNIMRIVSTSGNRHAFINLPIRNVDETYMIELKEKSKFGRTIHFSYNKKYENGKNFGEILKQEYVWAVKAFHQNKKKKS